MTEREVLREPIKSLKAHACGARQRNTEPWLSGAVRSHVAGIQARQQDRQRDDDPTLIEVVAACRAFGQS